MDSVDFPPPPSVPHSETDEELLSIPDPSAEGRLRGEIVEGEVADGNG